MVLQAICLILLAPATLACGYYLFLAAAAIGMRRPAARSKSVARHRFAIVIPAHDEEDTISTALRSCDELDYPAGHYEVYVIADNCSDATARVARAAGAHCLERTDPQRRGKGAALTWALPYILRERPDAIIVLDADCRLDSHALRTFSQHLAAGATVLQASYVTSNPDASIASYVGGVANLIENDLFYAPKSALGLAVLLRGTGMVFTRQVLIRCPWQVNSIVEDAEYTIRLHRAGYRVTFVPEVRVWSAFPTRGAQLETQRSRWVGGTLDLARRESPGLLRHGLEHRRAYSIDLGWTLIASVRSAVLVELAATCLFAVMCEWLVPGPVSRALLLTAFGVSVLHGMHWALAALRLGLTARRWSLLIASPRTIARMLGIASVALVLGPRKRWERTPR